MSDDGDRTPLDDGDELLLRQVHPSFVRDGRPSGQAFKPTKKDQGMLSVARSSVSSPADAFHLHTAVLGLPSQGTWGISVSECQRHQLKAFPDPLTSPPEKVADPAHAFIDFRGLSNGRTESKATQLRNDALVRGRLHPPGDAQS
jgi:hypothetical protein